MERINEVISGRPGSKKSLISPNEEVILNSIPEGDEFEVLGGDIMRPNPDKFSRSEGGVYNIGTGKVEALLPDMTEEEYNKQLEIDELLKLIEDGAESQANQYLNR